MDEQKIANEVFKRERELHKEPVSITITTKVPSKWRFVDLETHDIWQWSEVRKGFVKADILALVAEDRAGLVEALKEVKRLLANSELGSADRLIETVVDAAIEGK